MWKHLVTMAGFEEESKPSHAPRGWLHRHYEDVNLVGSNAMSEGEFVLDLHRRCVYYVIDQLSNARSLRGTRALEFADGFFRASARVEYHKTYLRVNAPIGPMADFIV